MADNPYLSLQEFNGNGSTVNWTVSFAGNRPDAGSGTTPYLSADDIEAYEVVPATINTAEYRIPRTLQVIGPSQVRVSPAVVTGRKLVVRRKTEDRFNIVDFQSLQAVSEFDLDQANRQLLFLTQEAVDQARLAEDAAVSSESIAYAAINIAQDAQDQSIAATSIANSAVASANGARAQADIAVNKADVATAAANASVTTANIAADNATVAMNQSGLAQAKADAATAASNSATTTANLALNRADTAIDIASSTIARSELALDNAEEALGTANTASANAIVALSTVDTANSNASTALSTANAIAGTANTALANSAEALDTANDAMALVTGSGVNSFNGRVGLVEPMAGDYNSVQVTHNGATVSAALGNLASSISASETAMVQYVNTQVGTRLPVGGQAADSAKFGGEFPGFYTTQSQLTAAINTRLAVGAKAASATSADQATKLATARTINGVQFDGSANILIADSTKVPVTGGWISGALTITSSSAVISQAGGAQRGILYGDTSGFGLLTNTGSWALRVDLGTNNVQCFGNLTAAGNITAYSDIRLKTNIDIITNALDKVGALGGYTYDRTDIKSDRDVGLLAQQVREVLPEAVREDKESGMLSLSYNGVVALLVEAINELREEVRELRDGNA